MEWKEKLIEAAIVAIPAAIGGLILKKGKPFLKELGRMRRLTDEVENLKKKEQIAEKRLRALLYSSPDPFVIKDNEGDVVFANPAFVQMVGVRTDKDVFGVGFNRTLTKKSREEFEDDKETFTTHPNSFEMVVEFEHEKTAAIITTLCRSEPVEYDGVLVETILRFTIIDKT